jgi:hypothetical protein
VAPYNWAALAACLHLNIGGGQLHINKDLTIAGPGAGRFTIKAFNANGSQNGSRTFHDAFGGNVLTSM